MKKVLAFLSLVAIAGPIGVASAADRSGKFGLGFQESFGQSGSYGTSSLGTWSLKYGINSKMTGQLIVGFDLGKDIDKNFSFGGRMLWDLVERDNSDFYTGLGVGWNQDESTLSRVLRINVPLGFEFNFPSLPEVALSAEAGIMYDYTKDATPTGSRISSVGGTVGGAFGLGIHYYF